MGKGAASVAVKRVPRPGRAVVTPPSSGVKTSPESHARSIPRWSEVHITFPSRHEPFRLRARPHEQPASQPGGPDIDRLREPVRHIDTQYGTFAANRQQTAGLERFFREEAPGGNVLGLVGC